MAPVPEGRPEAAGRTSWRRLRRDELRRQADEELEHPLSLRVEALVRRGVGPEEAPRRVLAEAGDLDDARRAMARGDASRQRRQRRRDLLSGWAGEVRRGLRSALRRPGLAALAIAELAALASEAPDGGEWTGAATPVADHLLGNVRRPLALLQAAVVLMLLIACANVGLLLLARSLRRREEMAVRRAMGGSPGRLVASGLAESLGLACLCGLVAGLLPAVHGARAPVTRALAESSSSRSGSRRADRTLSALVVGQVALSVTLLATAGVLLRGFLVVLGQDTGMEPDDVTTFRPTTAALTADVRDALRWWRPPRWRVCSSRFARSIPRSSSPSRCSSPWPRSAPRGFRRAEPPPRTHSGRSGTSDRLCPGAGRRTGHGRRSRRPHCSGSAVVGRTGGD